MSRSALTQYHYKFPRDVITILILLALQRRHISYKSLLLELTVAFVAFLVLLRDFFRYYISHVLDSNYIGGF